MRRILICLLLIGACLSGLLACGEQAKTGECPLRVTFLDVGEGDCTWIRTSAGDILIDSGPESAQESLCRRLKEKGLQRIGLLILTHPDEDHIGGADVLLETFPTEEVWINGATGSGESAVRMEDAIRSAGCAVHIARGGDWKESGEVLLTVLYPFPGENAASGNESSLILRIQCGDCSLLMMGDADEKAEQAMLGRYGPAILEADVLHVGHHGAASSTSKAFLDAVEPELAVISCGAANRYGHPDGRTLARLSAAECPVLRTDLEGDVELTSDGNEIFCPALQKKERD